MQTLQIVLMCCVLLFILVVAYRALYKKIVVPEPASPSTYSMMVAIRRRGTALDHYLKLSGDEKVELHHSLEKLSHILHERWLGSAHYTCGFVSDTQGLPAHGEYDWNLFTFYHIADYDHFRRCVAILEEPQFSLLRYYLDMRLIFGSSFDEFADKVAKLF